MHSFDKNIRKRNTTRLIVRENRYGIVMKATCAMIISGSMYAIFNKRR